MRQYPVPQAASRLLNPLISIQPWLKEEQKVSRPCIRTSIGCRAPATRRTAIRRRAQTIELVCTYVPVGHASDAAARPELPLSDAITGSTSISRRAVCSDSNASGPIVIEIQFPEHAAGSDPRNFPPNTFALRLKEQKVPHQKNRASKISSLISCVRYITHSPKTRKNTCHVKRLVFLPPPTPRILHSILSPFFLFHLLCSLIPHLLSSTSIFYFPPSNPSKPKRPRYHIGSAFEKTFEGILDARIRTRIEQNPPRSRSHIRSTPR